MPKSDGRKKAEAVVTYPLDWIEERTGLVGAIKYFLFRKVPGRTNWFHTLGSATLTAFLVQAITGVILAMYYKPDPDNAYESIQFITNDLTWGWLVRGMHRFGASVFIILLFFHMARVFLFGAYKYPREVNWMVGAALLILGMFEGFTGYLLPWDQTSYWASVVGINITGTGPFVGPYMAQILKAGAEINGDTLVALLFDPHARVTRGDLRPDRHPPLPRDPPRRVQPAVGAAGRGRGGGRDSGSRGARAAGAEGKREVSAA